MDKDPNQMTVGPTKWRADHCTTHHYACDCREWEFATRVAEYERDAERYRWLREYDVDSYLACGRLERLDAAIDTAMQVGHESASADPFLFHMAIIEGTKMHKLYSINEEDFIYSDASDALQALADNEKLVEGEIYYEIYAEPVNLAKYLEAERILGDAAMRVYDELGEAAEDAYHVSKEADAEWNTFVAAWAAKHLTNQLLKGVGKPRELVVTAEDVASHGA